MGGICVYSGFNSANDIAKDCVFEPKPEGILGMAKRQGGTRAKKTNGSTNGANLGFEAQLWEAADKLRNNMDAAEYKHVAKTSPMIPET